MLIAHISDTHISLPDAQDPRFADRIARLEAFVDHVGRMAEKPDAIVHTGDVSQDGAPEQYDAVRAIMRPLGVPVFFALGNRDRGAPLADGLKALGDARLAGDFLIYAVDAFPVRLVAMDTQMRGSRTGTTCPARLTILADLLDEKPDAPTVVFMHHPPFAVPTSKYPFQFDAPATADAVLDLIAGREQVAHVFCGHMHRPFAIDLATCSASITPSLAVDLRLGDYADADADRPMFHLHRWSPDARRLDTRLTAVGDATS